MEFAKFFSKENLIIALLLFFSYDIFFPIKDGISREDLKTEIELHDLEQENNLLKKRNNQYQVKINRFKDEKSKIDSITNEYNVTQIDSFYTNYFK